MKKSTKKVVKAVPASKVPLHMKPKSYVVGAQYVAAFGYHVLYYNYTDLGQAKRHIRWLVEKIAEQNGKDAVRYRTVKAFELEEYVRSQKRDRKLPPIKRFVKPVGRDYPAGGVSAARL